MKFNLKKFFMIIMIIAIMVLYLSVFAFADSPDKLAKLDATGNQLLYLARRIGFWIITVMATYKVIQCALKGNRKEVGEIIITYVLIYGSMFLIPWAMRLVEDIF